MVKFIMNKIFNKLWSVAYWDLKKFDKRFDIQCKHWPTPKGWFSPTEGIIAYSKSFVEKRRGRQNCGDLEIAILAHEYGHFLNYKQGGENQERITDAYEKEFLNMRLTLQEKLDIYTEEYRAWRNARRALISVGCKDFDFFNKDRRECLEGYRKGLNLRKSQISRVR